MTQTFSRPQQLARMQRPVLIAGGVGIALCILGSFFGHVGHEQFFRSWLFAWIFWLGVSLGSMGIVMMHHLTGGMWGYMIRRFGEAASLVIFVLAILFIPLFFGTKFLYPWAVSHDAVIQHKSGFLSWSVWSGCSIAYLVIFAAMAWLMRSRKLESPGVDPIPILVRLRRVSAAGIPIYFFVMTLASIHWIMSREPHWFSTVFGFIVCIGQAVSGACFLIMILWVFVDEPPFKDVIHPNYLNDLGNVLLTFVILWAYLSFAQFLVTWVGNTQQEIAWYIQRTDGGWRWVAAALIAFHFLVPFIILLQRPLKRKAGRLACIAAAVFFIHILDEMYWITASGDISQHGPVGPLLWLYAEAMNIVAFVGIGGIWLTTFFWILQRAPLLPVGERIPVIPVDHGHGQRPVPGALD